MPKSVKQRGRSNTTTIRAIYLIVIISMTFITWVMIWASRPGRIMHSRTVSSQDIKLISVKLSADNTTDKLMPQRNLPGAHSNLDASTRIRSNDSTESRNTSNIDSYSTRQTRRGFRNPAKPFMKTSANRMKPAIYHHDARTAHNLALRSKPENNKPSPFISSRSDRPNLVWIYELFGDQIMTLEQVHPDVAVDVGLEYTKWDRSRSANSPPISILPPDGANVMPRQRINRIWIWGK